MEGIYELCFYGGLALAIIFLIVSVVLFIVLRIPKVIGDLTGRSAKKDIKEKQQGAANKDNASKKEQAKYYNQGSGKITVRETVSEKTRMSNKDDTTASLKKALDVEETEVLNATMKVLEGEKQDSKSKYDVEETDVLRPDMGEEATDVLKIDVDEEATDVLKLDSDEEVTDVLKSESDEEVTAVLKAEVNEETTDILKAEIDEATDVLKAGVDEDATDVLKSYSDEEGDSTTVLTSGGSLVNSSRAKTVYNIVVIHTQENIQEV